MDRPQLQLLGLPARLYNTWQIATQRFTPETDPAQSKAPHVPARAPAHLAAVTDPHLVLALGFSRNHRFLRHRFLSRYLKSIHNLAQALQKTLQVLSRLETQPNQFNRVEL
jgi:hypothetical protein